MNAAGMLANLGFLIGTWTCSYAAGGQNVTYTATFAYDLGGNWIRERDAWPGGGGDLAFIKYVPKGSYWNTTVLEGDGSTTVFRGSGSGTHVVYHIVYPTGTNATETFDRVSSTKYATHFSGMLEGQKMSATDTCTKR